MTASLQIKKDRPNYFIVLAYKDLTTGKNKTKWISTDISVKGNNKRLANERMKEVLAEYENLDIDFSKDVLFTTYIKEWLENLKPSIELVTYDTYRLIVYNQIIPFFESKQLKLRELTPLHIQQYVNFKLKAVSPNTVRKHLWNISKCMDSAVKQNIILFNPVKRIDLPKKVKYTGAQHYDEKHIGKLLEHSKGDILEPIITLALFYGFRKSEIIGLKWNAIDFGRDTIAIQHTVVRVDKTLHKKDATKNNSSRRTMPIPIFIKELLVELKNRQTEDKKLQPNDYIDEGYIFTYPDGRLISPNYVSKRFKTILEKNSLPIIRFHDLRHSTASYLLYLGFSMKEIQAWLGHGDIGTTMNIYAHLDISAKQNMADVLNDKFYKLTV